MFICLIILQKLSESESGKAELASLKTQAEKEVHASAQMLVDAHNKIEQLTKESADLKLVVLPFWRAFCFKIGKRSKIPCRFLVFHSESSKKVKISFSDQGCPKNSNYIFYRWPTLFQMCFSPRFLTIGRL